MTNIRKIIVAAGLLGLLIMLSGGGCLGTVIIPPLCCPKIEFTPQDTWICKGKSTRIDYKITFKKSEEECKPEGLKISIKNLTDNIDVILDKPKEDKNNIGVYTGTVLVTLTKDTDYKIKIETSQSYGCVDTNASLRVNVVDKGDYHMLCFTGLLNTQNKCNYPGSFLPFGDGVKVDFIENPGAFAINVTKDKRHTEYILPYKKGKTFSNTDAVGSWSLGLGSWDDCLNKDVNGLCAKICLKCE